MANDSTTNRYRFSETTSAYGGWSSWTDIPSSPTFHVGSEPTVASFADLVLPQFLVIGVEAGTNNVRFATRFVSGAWSSWSTIAPPPGVVFRSVAAVQLTPNGAIYLAAVDTTVVGVYPTCHVWFGTLQPGPMTFSGWSQLMFDGSPVISEVGALTNTPVPPAMAAGPEGKLYLVTKSAVGSDRFGDINLYTFDPGSSTWDRIGGGPVNWPDQVLPFLSGAMIDGRPGVVWRAHRDAAGNDLPSGNGAMWFWYPVKAGQHLAYRWTNGKFTAAIQDFNGGWQFASQINREVPGSCYGSNSQPFPAGGAAALVAHPESIAVFVTQLGSQSCPDNVFHAPYADGEAPLPTLLSDHDDRINLAGSICQALHSAEPCRCNPYGWNTSCYTSGGGSLLPDECLPPP